MNCGTMGARYQVDAHRPAQDDANKIGLPVTVFYHPDYGWNHTGTFANILSDKQTTLAVTWLGNRYFPDDCVVPPVPFWHVERRKGKKRFQVADQFGTLATLQGYPVAQTAHEVCQELNREWRKAHGEA